MKMFCKNLILVICITIFLTGCPWPRVRQDPQFTSANINMNSRNNWDVLAPGADIEFEDDTSGETPRELVEPDVIRRADALLYVLNQYRGLTIVDLNTESVLSQTPTYGYPRDLYLVGERAYVLVSYARDIQVTEDIIGVNYGSKLYVYNIQNPAAVVEEGAFSFAGDLVDSRMVGNVIYAVTSEYSWYENEGGDVVSTDAVQKSYGNTGAISINIANPEAIGVSDSVSFQGYGNLIQATNYAIFVVANDYNTNNSLITYVDIDDPNGDIVVRGTAAAPGYMADKFKMDAWNGALRVVTNTWWPDRETFITTFDISNPDALQQLGQTTLESASGESLFATRFDGPRAYVVTYFTVDPLFVVDLSDPAAPQVLGELKIPGWSTHIEPRGDRLVALGVDDEDGRRVMVSLFDVTDPADPQRLDYASFGDGWSWSSAYGDVKALTVLDDMILVPFSGWNQGDNAGYDRLQFVSYTRDQLDVAGYVDLQGSVVRSFAYGDRYYAVTQEQLAVIDAGDVQAPLVEASVTLAENVVDVLPLGDGWVVEVVVSGDTGNTLLRAMNYAGDETAGALLLPETAGADAFLWNDAVVLIAPVYEYEPEYRGAYKIFLVDFSDLANPNLVRSWTAEIQPWWGGWWRGEPMPVDTVAGASDKMIAPWYPYYYGGASSFLAGDYLVLRGYRERYPNIIGGREAYQGLAVIDLADPDSIRYVGLGLENITGIEEADNLLYISTCTEIGDLWRGPIYCAYYLQTLNPFDLSVSDPVNVPGVFLHKVPGSNLLLLKDLQYTPNWGTITLLRSIAIDNNAATLLDSVQFPEGYWDVKASGNDIFYAGMPYTGGYYPEGDDVVSSITPRPETEVYSVGRYVVSTEGKLSEGGTRAVSREWCSLLGANDQQVYLTIGGSSIAKLDFNASPPALSALAPTMSYPVKIRFAGSAAYIPMGYSGVLLME